MLPVHPAGPTPALAPPPHPPLQLCVTDLGRWLAQRPSARLLEREAAHILRQLLASLAACQRHGLAYRDVKPQNLVRGCDLLLPLLLGKRALGG